nr:extracellular solute-binding protein [Chelatococcus sp. YT9]
MVAGFTQEIPTPTDTARLYELAKEEGTLTFYASGPAQAMQSFADAFSEKYPGVSVDVVRLSSPQQYQRFTQESEAGQHLADIVMLDPISMKNLIEAGHIADWAVPEADELIDSARMGTYAYTPYYSTSVIAYNVNKVTPEEIEILGRDWKGVLDPRFKGRFAVSDQVCTPCYGGLHMFLDPAKKDEFGEKFLHEIAAQHPRIYPEVNSALDRVVAGEHDFFYLAWESGVSILEQKGAPIRWLQPSPTPVMLVSGWFAVSKYAPHPNAARLFMNWWISREGSKIQQQLYGAAPTFKNEPDIREFVKEPWYQPVTEKYDIDIVRWEKNIGSDLKLFGNIIRSQK